MTLPITDESIEISDKYKKMLDNSLEVTIAKTRVFRSSLKFEKLTEVDDPDLWSLCEISRDNQTTFHKDFDHPDLAKIIKRQFEDIIADPNKFIYKSEAILG